MAKMHLLQSMNPIRRPGRPKVATACLLAYSLTMVGAALGPADRVSRAAPYPCQGHRCGCDAEHCWQRCCCFTPSEKLAWARAQHIRPPVDAEPVGHDDTEADHADADHALAAVVHPAVHSCCDLDQDTTAPQAPQGWRAEQCRGIATLWVTSGAALPAIQPSMLACDLIPCGWILPSAIPATLLSDPPPDPPPQAL